MPPVERLIPRFAAEPPQDGLPGGSWAQRLRQEFLSACLSIESDSEDLGEPGDVVWYPDRTWYGRTYLPCSAATRNGFELYGYVRFLSGAGDREAGDFAAWADYTAETAERNPQWSLDLCDEVIGSWRGEDGAVAAMTLVWGQALIRGGALATAELADLAVDQCILVEDRFTLIAPDDYAGDLLDIKLFGPRGEELARESLYDAGEDDDEQ